MFKTLFLSFLIFISTTIFATALSPQPSAAPQSLPMCNEIKFSYWAYHHTSCVEDSGKTRLGLHERGIVDQIQNGPRSSPSMYTNCCNGLHTGECRVTLVNMAEKKVLVDDKWVPISIQTKIVEVEGLDNDEEAVVCASRSFAYSLPAAYCIGIRGGS